MKRLFMGKIGSGVSIKKVFFLRRPQKVPSSYVWEILSTVEGPELLKLI